MCKDLYHTVDLRRKRLVCISLLSLLISLVIGGTEAYSQCATQAPKAPGGLILSTSASTPTTPPTASASGLVAHWKFDEKSGTTACDSSGNAHTGTLTHGPIWTTGKVGGALYFDGIDDVVTVLNSNSLNLASSFTVSAWVNPASTFADFRSVIAKNGSYYLYASSTGFCGDGSPFGYGENRPGATVCQPSPIPANTWTHLTLVYSGSTLTLYRNGVAVNSVSASGTLPASSGSLQIAASQFGEYFKGLIDEVRVYNTALTATDIQSMYQQESDSASSTVVATPIISPNGGSHSGSVSVTMQTATSGASIYYTTNGSTPTQSSTLYTTALTLTSSATVKAKAFKTGSSASAEASASFTIIQTFNFSLANSGNKSVVAASSVTNSLTTALVSGTTQSVAFSVSGLPAGAVGSFSTPSCSPACSSTLTVNTTASTPAGTSNVTVTATGGGIAKTSTFVLTVSLPSTANQPLVAYWKFDEGTGTSTGDASGNGNTGILTDGAIWASGKIGNALYFDGIDDVITVPNSNPLNLSNSFTLSAWVNPASIFNDFRSIVAKNDSYYLYASSAGFCGDGAPFGYGENRPLATVCQPFPLPANTWTHLALTYSGSTLTLYRNGVAVNTATASGTLPISSGTLQIGGSQFGEYFNGMIDELRIYNTVLTTAEIQTKYQEESGIAAGTSPVTGTLFSFSVSNSGNKSVVAGSSVTNSVSAALVSGISQAVSFSLSGLPAGATGTFSSPSCSPACSTILNISTTGSTPAGSFPITVTAAGGGVTKSTAFTLSVTLALTVATPTITPNGGNFSGSVSVAMQSATSGASIYYTTDGSTPTQSSSPYASSINVTNTTTFNAKAFKSGYNPSGVASASFTNSGSGRIYYVGKSGSNSNSCAQAQNHLTPKLTISAGLACMQGGDTLEIKQGTYEEVDLVPPSGTSSNRTVIKSFGTDTVTFTRFTSWNFYSGRFSYVDFVGGCTLGLNRNCRMVWNGIGTDCCSGAIANAGLSFGAAGETAHHIRFDGIRATNWGGVASNISNPNAFIEFRNSRFDNNGKFLDFGNPDNPVLGMAGYHFYIGGGQVLVENCELDHAGGYAIHQYGGGGNNNIYRYNVIHDNGLTVSANVADGILLHGWGSGHQAYGNLIYNNKRGAGITAVSSGSRIFNNTIFNNDSGIYVFPGASQTVIRNNITYGNRIAVINDGSGTTFSNNLEIDPKFVAPGSFDFRLQSSSPAINAGVTLTEVAIDLDGTSRPQGSAYDIGAFEYR
jgi:parallel beta-helix repeat protein